MNRDNYIRIRLSNNEKEKLRIIAKNHDMSISQYIRAIIDREYKENTQLTI